jgi:crotonobetainyl-CoA:carnitine CoA-transferase CaiB-like acyl-CoA transferase
MVERLDHPTVGAVSVVGIPFQMFGTPPSIRRPPPLLGQHSREVLVDDVGLDVDRFNQLVAAGTTTIVESQPEDT